MKKGLLLISSLLVSCSLAAQTIDWLPSDDTHDYQGIALSANGRYIAGLSKATASGFVWDTTDKKEYLSGEENGSILTGVSDNGIAVGYDTYDAPTIIDITTNQTSVIEEGIAATPYSVSSDGKVIVGYMTGDDGNIHACLWKDRQRTMLPEPTAEEAGLGGVLGTDAKWVSKDGSVILGNIFEDMYGQGWPLAMIWRLQEDGTYKPDCIYSDFYDVESNASKPYYSFEAAGISDNGKWVSLKTKSYGTYQGQTALNPDRLARMNIETRQVKECVPGNGLLELGYITGGISNDGTVVGAINPNNRQAVIWKAGEASARTLAMGHGLMEISELYNSAAIGISADGRYITGFGKVEEGASKTFWIDTKGTTNGIANAETTAKHVTTSVYDVDGTFVGSSTKSLPKGIYIVKTSGGKATTSKKIIVNK